MSRPRRSISEPGTGTKQSAQGCSGQPTKGRARSLSAIVRAYLKLRPGDEHWGLNYYADAPNLPAAIERAVLSETAEGKRHSHQRRIPGRVLRQARSRLLNVDLSEIASFDDLHERVESAIGRIKGIGPLTIYDIAHRLGVYLGVRPKDVYLHCGTREGAKALGLDYTAEKLAVSDLPAPLHALQPDQIEDCLCIFKDDIRRLRRATDPQD